MFDVSETRDELSGQSAGTRFLVFPQPPHLAGYEKPVPVWISTPPGEVLSGPADRRMYVVDPIHPKEPYAFPILPPYPGDTHPPAVAGPDGHFDHLDIGSREFLAAHAFACLRYVLDIWESYLGHEIRWHFGQTYERLEIIPYVEWYNAQSGFGYIELGTDRTDEEAETPYALNFDVIAHEFGHALIFGEMGMPDITGGSRQYFGYHEAVSDMISLISTLHFDSVSDRLIRRTKGNLLTLNELNRIAELADNKQIRLASNDRRMSDVTDQVHDLSKPFTGALFDTLVEIYHALVVENDLVDLPDEVSWYRLRELTGDEITALEDAFAETAAPNHFRLKSALATARDVMGIAIARSWAMLDPNTLDYASAGLAIVDQLDAMGETAATDTMLDNLQWREIVS